MAALCCGASLVPTLGTCTCHEHREGEGERERERQTDRKKERREEKRGLRLFSASQIVNSISYFLHEKMFVEPLFHG